MSKRPAITVIMAAYNCDKYISESINSIINQTFEDFEFLIADDCSTDKTKQIIDGFTDRRIITYHNSSNKHVAYTWNNLLNYAKGEYITFQDADDISYPLRLEKLYNFALKNPNLAVIGSNFIRPFKDWKMFVRSNYVLSHEEIIRKIDSENQIDSDGPRALFKAEVIREFSGFRSIFEKAGWEDFDLFLRISAKYKVANIPDALYEYRYYNNSYSRIEKSNISFRKIFIHQIGLFLYHQRKKNNGLDGLMESGNKKEFDEYISDIKKQFLKDKSIAYRKKVKNQCANKDFKNALFNTFRAIKTRVDVFENWSLFGFWIKSFLRTWVKFILISIKLYKREDRYCNMHL